MNVGMVSVTFKGKSIKEVFEYAKAAGIEGIEWGICANHMELLHSDKAKEIKGFSEQYGISVFSLGSYCYMERLEEALEAVETARMLQAPSIRVWAGRMGSLDCNKEAYDNIVENTKAMALKAREYGIKIGFEYHPYTLTDTAESAVKLVRDIHMDNVGLYWQPRGSLSTKENLCEFQYVLPYLIGNLHIQNYSAESGYQLLEEIEGQLREYYKDVKNQPYNLLVEFVKEGSLESLISDVKCLKRIVRS